MVIMSQFSDTMFIKYGNCQMLIILLIMLMSYRQHYLVDRGVSLFILKLNMDVIVHRCMIFVASILDL